MGDADSGAERNSSLDVKVSAKAAEEFFQTFRAADFSASSTESYTPQELDVIVAGLSSAYKATVKANESDIGLHICFILLRCGQTQTSKKYKSDSSFTYKINNSTYTVSDLWMRSTVERLGDAVSKKPNPLRCFCSSFEDLYISMAKIHPHLFKSRTIGRRGAPTGYEYLTADFLTGCSNLLEDRERAVSIRASENALVRHNASGNEKLLVSLYDL